MSVDSDILSDTLFDSADTKFQVKNIEKAFLAIAGFPEIQSSFPTIKTAAKDYLQKIQKAYDEAAELAFLNLYCEIHRAGSLYSSSERQKLDDKHGYFNHPGGLSPVFKAKQHITKNSVVADLGAGNGLQGLLFQYLYPHKKTLQIELSKEMIDIGKIYQNALEISEDKIVWINDDILNVSLNEIDFLYLYRPSKPIKNGISLYKNLEQKLNSRKKSLIIYSIADCLKDYLGSQYQEFYNDGHLTCFQYLYDNLGDEPNNN